MIADRGVEISIAPGPVAWLPIAAVVIGAALAVSVLPIQHAILLARADACQDSGGSFDANTKRVITKPPIQVHDQERRAASDLALEQTARHSVSVQRLLTGGWTPGRGSASPSSGLRALLRG